MFYDNYIRVCALRGEKPTPVAQKVGCTSSKIAQWKKGSTPRSAVLQKIADYLEVSPQYLLFGDDGGEENADVKKERPADGEALTDEQKDAIEFIKGLSDDELKWFIAGAKAMLKGKNENV